uniref:DSBA-like thioredoxin domain-containing protein n=1 Tax=Labrus bergylta TaxID=56723 RepID=A0A3Q3FHE6_9LABR
MRFVAAYRRGRREETSRWSGCPGSCGEESGVRTKTSLNLHHYLRYKLMLTGCSYLTILKSTFQLCQSVNFSTFLQAALKAGLSDSEIKEVLNIYTSQEIKDKLKSSSEDALDYGAFGFPIIVCHVNGKPEMFFGSDRFELMANCIGEKWLGPQPDKSAAKL